MAEGLLKLSEGQVLHIYQLHGLHWLKALYKNVVNDILADEMGLHETTQVNSLMRCLKENVNSDPFLMVG